MSSVTLTHEQFVQVRDAMYTADHGLRAVLDDTVGNDPGSLKRARNLLALALADLRIAQRAAQTVEEGADAAAPKPPASAAPTAIDRKRKDKGLN
jgi:hypothetical protein